MYNIVVTSYRKGKIRLYLLNFVVIILYFNKYESKKEENIIYSDPANSDLNSQYWMVYDRQKKI